MIDPVLDDLKAKFPPEYTPPHPVHIRGWISEGKRPLTPFYITRESPIVDMGIADYDNKIQSALVDVVSAAAYAAREYYESDQAYIYGRHTPMMYGTTPNMHQLIPGVFLLMTVWEFSVKIVVNVYMMKYTTA